MRFHMTGETTRPNGQPSSLNRTLVLDIEGLPPGPKASAARALGEALRHLGRTDEAKAHYEQALAIHREVGNRSSEGSVLGNLGYLHGIQGRMDEARSHYEQALAIHREVGNRRFEGVMLGNLAGPHWSQGRMDEAKAQLEQGLAIAREVGDGRLDGTMLDVMPFVILK